MHRQLHMLSEQANIQWALRQKEKEPYLPEVATLILKLLWQHRDDLRDMFAIFTELGHIFLQEAERGNENDFCRRALQEI